MSSVLDGQSRSALSAIGRRSEDMAGPADCDIIHRFRRRSRGPPIPPHLPVSPGAYSFRLLSSLVGAVLVYMSDEPHLPTLAAEPPGKPAKKFALGMVALSVLAVAVITPLARTPLPSSDAFIPAYEAALAINDLITAALLVAQFLRQKTLGLLVLACTYLFSTMMIVVHALTFPGVFAPKGLLGAGPQTTAWLYVFWHGGFAVGVLMYALTARQADRSLARPARSLFEAAAATLAVAAGLSLYSTVGHDYLPAIMDGSRYTMAITKGISPSICLISLAALFLLWRVRNRSALDLWLLVVMSAWLCDVLLGAVVGSSRFDLGWYGGRSFSFFASGVLLIAMLFELNRIQDRMFRAELHRATSLFEAVINMTPDLVFVKDLNSRALLRNPAALFGRTWEEIEGRKEADWHARPDEAEQVVRNDRQVIETGKAMQFVEHFTTDKGERVLLSTKSPLFDEDGKIVGTIGVSTDITEREARAKHVEFIMSELSHRSKNLLSVIIAIARQSIRQSASLEDFGMRFNDRLSALARLHDILVQQEWRGASLQAIAQSQIAPFAGNRLDLDGPNINVRPDVAQVLSMVFHELATNAAKYGALSAGRGRVSVTWGPTAEERRLAIQWEEGQGPPVVAPQQKGFGSIVVERMALQIVGASASLKYLSTGVIWYLEAPLESIVSSTSAESGDPRDFREGPKLTG